MRTKFLGFTPDIDPRTPGAIIDGDRFVPSQDGFKPSRSPVSVGLPALDSACLGSVVVKKLDDSQRFFAGTRTKLYQSNAGTSWTDVSNGTYTGGAESLWRFAQFGDNSYAVNGVDPMQYSDSGSFADRGGNAPIVKIIEPVWPGFLMTFDYNDGVDYFADGWYCSALKNDANWTPSIANQCAKGRLLDTEGRITAGKRLGSNVIAYKDRSMYIGTYVGPPFIWDWQLIPGDIGAPSNEAVVNINTAHIFPGYENFYYFDGSRPIPIGNPLKDWYNTNIDRTYKYKMQSLHDRNNSNVFFFYPDSTGTIQASLVYNYRADKWGKASLYDGRSLEATVEYLSGGSYTYDSLGDFYNTWDDLPTDIPYDSPFWTASTAQPAIFQEDHIVYSLTGDPINSDSAKTTIYGNYQGNDDEYSIAQRMRLDFIYKNLFSADLTLRTTDYVGDSLNSYGPYALVGNKFDFQRTAKWHTPLLTLKGDFELTGFQMTRQPEGED